MTIWLIQWLCPSRHCALAAAWDPTESDEATVKATGEAQFREGGLNRWCGICGGSLVAESAPTVFDSLAAARATFDQVEAEQLASRAAMDELGLTYDVQRRSVELPQ